MNDIACFIFSHGRSKTLTTPKALRDGGYTGLIYIIIDNEDDEIEEYKKLETEKQKVIVFNKSKYINNGEVDSMDNWKKHEVILWARYAAYDIASELGIENFIQFDDDVMKFCHRYISYGKLKTLLCKKTRSLDFVFSKFFEYMDIDERIKSIAMFQGGDLIGGAETFNKINGKRKCMNSWFCKTSRRILFTGTLNDDVSTYCLYGSRGDIFISFNDCMLDAFKTQCMEGGITETYADMGTYVKSFYTILCCPSFVKIGVMNSAHKRIHHKINFEHGVPKIISSRWCKNYGKNSER